jgi:hypothetical protein
MKNLSRIRRRLLDIAAEVGIAIALLVGIAVYAFYGPKHSAIDAKWIGFVVNSLFVFGYVL